MQGSRTDAQRQPPEGGPAGGAPAVGRGMSFHVDGIDEPFFVRHIAVAERMSRPFEVTVYATSESAHLDLDASIAQAASASFLSGYAHAGTERHYHGVVVGARQDRTEREGQTSYTFQLAPRLSLLGERHNYRHFQHQTVLDIARALLDEWGVPHQVRAAASYPSLEMRVQYGETDLDFLERLLEDEGISYAFESDESTTRVVLDDRPQSREARTPALRYVDNPNEAAESEYVTAVRFERNLRAGRYRVRTDDFRRPRYDLARQAEGTSDAERTFERYHYRPGSFLTEGHPGGDTPTADNLGTARHDEGHGARLAQVGLERHQSERDRVSFSTNAFDIGAGRVWTLEGHPRSELGDRNYLTTEFYIDASDDSESTAHGVAVFADRAHRPKRRHDPRVVHGLIAATVVGPPGEEIHVDEFGRVRVKFHWDQSDASADRASAWLRVCHSWAGGGFGTVMLPRVGDEVVVGFMAGNPDEPVVMGRLYNAQHPHPYRLPQHKTRSTWKSRSTPRSDGYNELRFEDKAGHEEVYLHAQRNRRKVVRCDESNAIGNDRSTSIGRDDKIQIKRDHAGRVDGWEDHSTHGKYFKRHVVYDEHRLTEGKQLNTVVEDRHDYCDGTKYETVKRSYGLVVKRNLLETARNKATRCTNHYEVLSQNVIIEAESTLDLVAAEHIRLVVGGSIVLLKPNEVVIHSPMVRLNFPGDAGLAGMAPHAVPYAVPEADRAEIEPVRPPPDDGGDPGGPGGDQGAPERDGGDQPTAEEEGQGQSLPDRGRSGDVQSGHEERHGRSGGGPTAEEERQGRSLPDRGGGGPTSAEERAGQSLPDRGGGRPTSAEERAGQSLPDRGGGEPTSAEETAGQSLPDRGGDGGSRTGSTDRSVGGRPGTSADSGASAGRGEASRGSPVPSDESTDASRAGRGGVGPGGGRTADSGSMPSAPRPPAEPRTPSDGGTDPSRSGGGSRGDGGSRGGGRIGGGG
jgi:type VI secretion system secreted protein VgrG